jgi:sigma-B regulation protein RsbU (phosphoserine phosphatase)
MTALVVGDDPVVHLVLQDVLQSLNYKVTFLEDGLQAWDQIQKDPFRLVIADWEMPGLSGLELAERIRKANLGTYVYLILVTSNKEKKHRLRGIAAGADDFLTKPLQWDELESRLTVAERLLSMENALKDAKAQLEETQREQLQIGARIQNTLLDGQVPAHSPYFDIATLSVPSAQIDGDFVEFFPHSDHVLDILIGDGMGKGLTAALLGAGTKAFFQKAINKLLAAGNREGLPSPREIVQHVHDQLSRELIRLESFVTLTYVRLDAVRGQATIVDCGHTEPYFWSAERRKGWFLDTQGNFPLGFSDRETYVERSFAIRPGDGFILYSDGLTEARSPSGEQFGSQRFLKVSRENDHLALPELIVKFQEEVHEFTQAEQLQDDFTCVIAQWLMEIPREISVKRDHTELATIREFVASTAAKAGLKRNLSLEIQLAVHEYFRNIVEHGTSSTKGPVSLRAESSPDVFKLTIVFEGTLFEPEQIALPDLELYPETGFGLFIIKESVDDFIEEHRADGLSEAVMTKRIPLEAW